MRQPPRRQRFSSGISRDRSGRELEKEGQIFSKGWVAWLKDPILVLVVAIVFAADQVTKAVVRHSLLLGEAVPYDGTFRIVHTFNTGSAFGLFPDQKLFLIIASLVGIGVLLMMYRNRPSAGVAVRLSIGLLLGGALGNLVDRVRMGHVTDFIELGFWPVFNVADASIVVGIAIAVVFLLFGSRQEPSSETSTLTEPGYGRLATHVFNDPGTMEDAGTLEDWDARPHQEPREYPSGYLGDEVSAGSEKSSDDSCQSCGSVMTDVPEGRLCTVCGGEESTW